MDQIIASLSQKLNLPESAIRAGLGVILRFIKEKAEGSQFETLIEQVPGAKALLAAEPAEGGSGSGLFGGLLGAAGGLLGGQTGDAAKALGALQQAGIPLDKAAPLAEQFLEQAKGLVGPETVESLLNSVPALKALLGGKAE